VTNFISGSEPV